MSIYSKMTGVFKDSKYKHHLFRHLFNLSPMYRRSTGRLIYVSEDIKKVRLRVKKSWRNINYMNTIFGGSMFSAVDPIPLVMLTQIIGHDYIIWDKSAVIKFIKPGNQDLYADIEWTDAEIKYIKEEVSIKKEMTLEKVTQLKNKQGTKVFCEVTKTIYVADKTFYKQKKNQVRKEQ